MKGWLRVGGGGWRGGEWGRLRGRNDCWWGVKLVMCERVEGADR